MASSSPTEVSPTHSHGVHARHYLATVNRSKRCRGLVGRQSIGQPAGQFLGPDPAEAAPRWRWLCGTWPATAHRGRLQVHHPPPPLPETARRHYHHHARLRSAIASACRSWRADAHFWLKRHACSVCMQHPGVGCCYVVRLRIFDRRIEVAIRIAISWTCLKSASCHVCTDVMHDELRRRQGERRGSEDPLDAVAAAAASCVNSRACWASHWRRLSAFAADFTALASCSIVRPGALFTLGGLPDAAGDAPSDAAMSFRLSVPAQTIADASIAL